MRRRKPIYSSGIVQTRKSNLQKFARGMDKAGMEVEITPMLKTGGVYSYKIYKKRRR